MNKYLSINRINEIISSIEIVIENLNQVKVDENRWKWIIIATHNALQNTMVEALWLGNGFRAMTEKSVEKWMRVHQEKSDKKKYPTLKLANFPELYKRICDKDIMVGYIHSKVFTAEDRHGYAVDKLNKIRNRFIHFELTIWNLNINGIPNIIMDCIDILKFLVQDSNNILIADFQDQDRLNKSIDKLVHILREINKDVCDM
ncbi:MAG: hypothetical protein BWK73_53025 [Thiothrix lacustris]|uniref:MAE-28990/MAE-18760-like HEPN domain-containing protein n=1 Tax=Thiothrix lacustris TaxID=525917 RepID=A0A1Y1Q7D4_9GAMM|nr:MAG: hypothetical protein BWK73_53025 [Thiothrix lacustris]